MNRRQLLAFLGSGLPLLAQEPSADESIWKEYLAWLGKEPRRSFLGLIDYRQSLSDRGLTRSQVERYMALISDRAITRQEAMKIWFNSVYSTNHGFFSERPNAFLADAMRALRPGTALDVSMGQGRNSVFLAQMGWDVTGFDVSDEGLAIARKHAEKAGVKIKTVTAGYQDFEFGSNRWDLIAMIYAFIPLHDPAFVRKIVNSLRPGGVIVLESRLLTDRHAEGRLSQLIGITLPNELRTIFGNLTMVRYEEVDAAPDFGSGTAPLVRMIARCAKG